MAKKPVTPDNRATKGATPPKVPPHAQPLRPPPVVGANTPHGPTIGSLPTVNHVTGGDSGGGSTAVVQPPSGITKPGDMPPGTDEHDAPPGTTTDTKPAESDPSVDWAKAFFGALGLPDDVMGQVTKVLRDHAQDQNLAQALATQYIRSTSWYSVHFPGALEGIANGTIANERDYTQYMHNINALSKQYQGRDVSGDEVKGYLQAGYDTGYVGKLYGGQSWVAANKGDVQYDLGAFGDTGQTDAAGLTALGNENAGIDTAFGQQLQNQVQKSLQRLHGVFQGTLAQGANSPKPLSANPPDVAA